MEKTINDNNKTQYKENKRTLREVRQYSEKTTSLENMNAQKWRQRSE